MPPLFRRDRWRHDVEGNRGRGHNCPRPPEEASPCQIPTVFTTFATPHRDHHSYPVVRHERYRIPSRLATDIRHLLSYPQDHVRRDHPVVDGGSIAWTGRGGHVDEVERGPSGGDRQSLSVGNRPRLTWRAFWTVGGTSGYFNATDSIR